jgi:hypothetical protein
MPPTVARIRSRETPMPVGEPVPDRNLRGFRAEVLPQLTPILRDLLTGSGEVLLEQADAFDTRLDCTFALEHRLPVKPAWTPRVRLLHDTHTGFTKLMADLYGWGHCARLWPTRSGAEALRDPATGEPLDPTRPDLPPAARSRWRNPVTGRELGAQYHTFLFDAQGEDRIAAAFGRLRPDARTAAEKAAFDARLLDATRPYLGGWRGPSRWTRDCELKHEAGRVMVVERRDAASEGPPSYFSYPLWWPRVGPDGTLRATLCGDEGHFRPGGRRIDFPATGDWLTRVPAEG